MAWLSGWSYRKEITITGQSGAGTNYQVKFNIGDSAGGDFHLEGHCTNFPQDIEVTDNDGTTLLKFWIKDITADPLEMSVKVADDLGSNQTIYVYYGKSGATTNSDGITTFDNYADKDDYSTDFNSNGASVSGDYISVGIAGTDSWGTNYLVAKSALDRTAKGYVAEFLLKGTGTDSSEDEAMFGFATDNALTNPQCDFAYQAGTALNVYEDGVLSESIDTITWTNEIKYTLEYPINIGVEYFVDDVSKRTNAGYTSDPGKCRITPYSGPVLIKYIFVRKFIVTEPAFSSAGSEETPPTGVSPTSVFYGPLVGPLGGPI